MSARREGLGFAKEGFQNLLSAISASDLRIGARFTLDRAMINRTHTYPDLALPIDAAQERVFAAIDGRRSIAEITRATAGAGGDTQFRRFFEQLWQYDQIVFDVTQSKDEANNAHSCRRDALDEPSLGAAGAADRRHRGIQGQEPGDPTDHAPLRYDADLSRAPWARNWELLEELSGRRSLPTTTTLIGDRL
jgi:hypothetical protein